MSPAVGCGILHKGSVPSVLAGDVVTLPPDKKILCELIKCRIPECSGETCGNVLTVMRLGSPGGGALRSLARGERFYHDLFMELPGCSLYLFFIVVGYQRQELR